MGVLTEKLGLDPLERREMFDLTFLYKSLNGKVDYSVILSAMSFHVSDCPLREIAG